MKLQDPTKVDKIIIHCSSSNIGTEKLINSWHTASNNPAGQFEETGYHFLILNGNIGAGITLPSLDGAISPGRPLKYVGAHCQGKNTDSIGICLIGTTKFTDAQMKALAILVRDLEAIYKKDLLVYGHRYFDHRKSCPNFSTAEWSRKYLTKPQPIEPQPIEPQPIEPQPIEKDRIGHQGDAYVIHDDAGGEFISLQYPETMSGLSNIRSLPLVIPISQSSD